MKFTDNNFTLFIEEEKDPINIYLYNSDYHPTNPACYLALTPLWRSGNDHEENMKSFKLGINGNRILLQKYKEVQGFYSKGDYFQSSASKYDGSFRNSYLAIIHGLLLTHSDKLNFIKTIYSTSLNGYEWESFISLPAHNFWNRQFALGEPYGFYENDQRFFLKLNE